MVFSISHTISTLNQYNPSSRDLGIILVSRVDTDAILKKPYDILYLFYFNLCNILHRLILEISLWCLVVIPRTTFRFSIFSQLPCLFFFTSFTSTIRNPHGGNTINLFYISFITLAAILFLMYTNRMNYSLVNKYHSLSTHTT